MLSVGKILTRKPVFFKSLKLLNEIFYTLYMYNNCFYMILDKESQGNRKNRKS